MSALRRAWEAVLEDTSPPFRAFAVVCGLLLILLAVTL